MIRGFDPQAAADAELDRVHDLLERLHVEANSREPYRSPAETRGFLRYPRASRPVCCWVAEVESRVLGFARLVVLEGAIGYAEVGVLPHARRQGIGSALLDAVRRHARDSGCERLLGDHATSAGARFAARAGATDTRREIRSLLTLARADLTFEPVAGYRVRSWTGAAPEALVDSLARAREAINDAPAPGGGYWDAWSVARVRDEERMLEQRGREQRLTVALDAGDDVVAFTELRVSRERSSVAQIEDTAVVREHRGKGLGGWIKADSLDRLRHDRPDVALAATTNAESNTAIRRLNERLGFVPVATSTACEVAIT